jgi:hypothetical protein
MSLKNHTKSAKSIIARSFGGFCDAFASHWIDVPIDPI